MTKRQHLKKTAYKSDPLVDLDPACLRAAIDAAGWSVQKLAKEIGNHSQTLDHLAKGDRLKRCRVSRRRGLAERLGVPEQWLAGGRSTAVPELGRLPRDLALGLSPRLQLATGALFRKAATALHRDWNDPKTLREVRGIAVTEDMLRDWLWWYLFELIRLDWWRAQLTTWYPTSKISFLIPVPGGEPPGILRDHAELRSEEEDRVGVALVKVLESALDPWFRGEAQLDYDRLRVLVGYDRADPGLGYPRYHGKAADPSRMIPQVAMEMPQ